jgi:N-hydroxyarylamine O-acetyltransferase
MLPAHMTESLVSAYLSRIGVTAPLDPDLSLLRRIHTAHVGCIPFENLDILLGRPIRLDLDSLRAKLVEQRRGGYCFEQNTLLLAVLRGLGFEAIPFEARVRTGESTVRPRTHMLLAVQTGDREWLVDVGFGSDGPLEPVPMTGEVSLQSGIEYRVADEGHLRVLQSRIDSGWIDLYAFAPVEVYAVDFEVGNWYTSTWPQSVFVKTLTAQRSTPEVRYTLRYPTYSERRGSEIRSRVIERAELRPLLRDVFAIDLAEVEAGGFRV